jgi:GDP-L-fucose synthase
MSLINKEAKIFIAGHNGMVGSAIKLLLMKSGYTRVIFRSSKELDLRNQNIVERFFRDEKPKIVIDCAAKVGGILANTEYPYQFLMDNLLIQNNLINSSKNTGVEKFLFLGSSCIYPKFAEQPIKEESLLTGSLEPTNQWYALAKIAGVKACEAIKLEYKKDFICLMPTNLFGPRDNFDLNTSHVLPAMIRKFHEAKVNGHSDVVLWGSGEPMREFLHVNDLAKAILFTIENTVDDNLLNIGTGADCSIKELALIIQEIIGHEGEIIWDSNKPDGTPRKLLDVSKIHNLGWKHEIGLKEGIMETYDWYLNNINNIKKVQF